MDYLERKNNLTFLMIIAMIFWGGNWVSAKLIEPTMPVNIVVFYRFFFAGLGFLPLLFFRKISFRLTPKQCGMMGLCSLLMGTYQLFFFKGLHEGFAGAGGVLVTTLNPLFTFFLMAIIKRKSLQSREWIGLSLGIASAVFFLQLWSLNSHVIFDSGNIYFLTAACIWSVLTMISQTITVNTLLYTFYAFTLVSPLFLIGAKRSDILSILHQSPIFWLNLGLIVVFGTVFSTTMYFYVTQKLGAKIASSYIFLVPSSAILFAWIFLHEIPTFPTLIGGALALSAVYALNK